MTPHDEAFNDQIEFLLLQYRQGGIKSVSDLMKLIKMAYGDYIDFHPNELPAVRHKDTEVDNGAKRTKQFGSISEKE